jgi:putative membrane protein
MARLFQTGVVKKNSTMNKMILALTFCVGLLSQTGFAANAVATPAPQMVNDTLPAGDSKFVRQAAKGGMMEVQLGQAAQTKAISDKVKQFGQMMVTDHTKANDELMALTQQKNTRMPANIGPKAQDMVNPLTALSGKEFDKAYMKMMVKDHKKDIKMFSKEAKKGTDPDVKAWATGKVDVLKHHLQMAKDTYAEAKKG